ncbi:MAG: tetratricopeptide repeat protein [Candidatus Heimdallarchaeota archaeon]
MRPSDIQDLMVKGHYQQALNAIEELGPEERLDGLTLQGRILERQGELQEGLSIAEQAWKESQTRGTPHQQLNAVITLAYCHLALGNLDTLLEKIQKGESLLEAIAKEENTSHMQYKGTLKYLRGFLSFMQGKIPLAVEQLSQSLEIREQIANLQEIAETAVAIGWVHLNGTGKMDLVLEYFERSLSIGKSIGNKTDIAHSLNRLGTYYNAKQDFDQALSYYEKSLALYQVLENKPWISGLLNNIANIHNAREEYDAALATYQQCLEFDLEIGNKQWEAMAYNNIGFVYQLKGELDLALEYFEKAIALAEELGMTLLVVNLAAFFGGIYANKGDLEAAHDYYSRSLKLSQEAGSEIHTAWQLLYLAWVYNLKGEPELALDHIDQSQKIMDELANEIGICSSLIWKGVSHKILGDLDLATTYFEHGWHLVQKFGAAERMPLWGSFILLQLILVVKDRNAPEEAKKYFDQMQELRRQSTNKYVDLRTRFAAAISLRMSKRGSEKLQAQQLFQEIVDEEILQHEITVLAMLNLCELLILEMKISEDEEVLLLEINKLTNRFYDIAHRQNSAWLSVVAFMLQAKMAMVEGNLEAASNLLEKAHMLASEKKLGNLLTKVEHERTILQEELDKWEELSRRNASIKERVEQARLEDYLTTAMKLQETWVQPSADMIEE